MTIISKDSQTYLTILDPTHQSVISLLDIGINPQKNQDLAHWTKYLLLHPTPEFWKKELKAGLGKPTKSREVEWAGGRRFFTIGDRTGTHELCLDYLLFQQLPALRYGMRSLNREARNLTYWTLFHWRISKKRKTRQSISLTTSFTIGLKRVV